MLPPNFYNQGDQGIYAAGDFFIPQERYRAAPYNASQPNNPDEVPAGIPAVYQAQGGGGYTGGVSDLTGNFFQTIGDRQNRLNNPSDTFLGFNTMKDQQLTGADAGEYIGSGMAIPQEKTFAGNIQDFLTPQSADDIIAGGYEPKMKLGIMANLLPDRYGELPRGDQAFIARNMGYTGPTVFGANDSGLSKDVFGMNTRSGFGNYAEAVGKQVDKLGDSLSATGAIGGKKDFQGATFNPATGMFESDELTAEQVAELNRRTKMVRAKYKFYTDQTKQRDADRKAAEEARMKESAANRADARDITQRLEDDFNRDSGGGFAVSGPDTSANPTGASNRASQERGFALHGADGGRVAYMDGGLADMLEIYD